MRDDVAYLLDILIAAKEAREFVHGKTQAEFLRNRILQRAVNSCIQDIGEASKKLSDSFKKAHPLVPWKELTVKRNELAHQYFRIDVAELWHILQTTLPGLIEYIEPQVPKEND